MSIKVEQTTCVLTDRVIPVSVSPIDYARGNGSNNVFKYEPLQISKVSFASLVCITPKKEIHTPKSVPTIKLK